MFEKFKRSLDAAARNPDSKFKLKNIVAFVIFGAIILVFALSSLAPERMGSDLGGTAAVVDGHSISVGVFRRRLDVVERNLNLDQFPAAQREMFAKELRRRTLDDVIASEMVFQQAQKLGLRVSDEEVRKTITSIDAFNEGGRFVRSRYENYLMGSGQSAGDFEREIRKDLMAQKIQALFVSSQVVPVEIQDGLKSLNQVVLSFNVASLNPEALVESTKVSPAQVKEALASNLDDVKAEYERRKIDFNIPERVKARHILIQKGEGAKNTQALAKLSDLKKELTVANFAAMAKKYSEDPGSKDKGGELGYFERGRMVPQFEEAAFSLPVGKISDTVESDFGYHLILVDEKQEGGQKEFDAVKEEVAQKYLARKVVNEKLQALNENLKAGKINDANADLAAMGVKWNSVKDVKLGADSVQGLTAPVEDTMRLLALRRGQLGLIPEVKEWDGQRYVFNLTSWKSQNAAAPTPAKDVKKEDAERDTTTERLAGDAFQRWVTSLNEKVDVEKNSRLLQ